MANNAGAVVELDADANGGVDIGKGGTNSTTAAAAATALGVGTADDVVHSTLNLTGGTGTLALGTPSTNTGIVHWKNAVNAFIFSQQSGTTGADYTWTWPTAQSGGAGFLLNVGATGVMGYTDPATFDLPSSTDGQMLQSNAGTYESTSTLSSIVFSMAGAQSNLLFNTADNFLNDAETDTDHVLSASKIISLDALKASLTGANFTGAVTAPVNTLTKAAGYTLTSTEASGSLTIATAAMTLTLPTAVAGYSGCLMAGQGVTAIIQLAPATGDYLVTSGVRGTAATARASGGAAGDKICFVAANADDWYITSEDGTWAE